LVVLLAVNTTPTRYIIATSTSSKYRKARTATPVQKATVRTLQAQPLLPDELFFKKAPCLSGKVSTVAAYMDLSGSLVIGLSFTNNFYFRIVAVNLLQKMGSFALKFHKDGTSSFV
jgi:hypothetical protein